MWRRVLRWIGIVTGIVLVLLALAVLGLYFSAGMRLNKSYTVPADGVLIPTDAESIARGQHRVEVGCTGCHGENLAGGVVFDDPSLAHIEAANLTQGQGGVGSGYSDADFVRAIRYGVDPDGRPLLVMPSTWYYYFSDEDLGAIVAYLTTLPPVDRETRGYTMTPLGRVLFGAGAFGNILGAEVINRNGPRPLPRRLV